MTGKRFEMIITGADGSFHYLDKNTGEKITSTLELENKLNALHEENKQLKQSNSQLAKVNREGVKKVQKLAEENEQLKHDATVLIYSNQEYRKENEQLREALKNSYMNEICENCKYGHYWISESYGFGLEGEFECTKKHFGNDHWKCDGLTECDDFELDLKGDWE